ncbi:MAG: DUF4013 domain-containing protein [Anaerolineae bacterium]|jgi:hypothetical protein|nr:DUF4013 domain-containing protein [Chloroflexota bacterium]
MDIGKAFTFIPEDKEWLKKIAIGGVLTLLPVANFIPQGYALRVMRNVATDEPAPLPEWSDWGGDLKKGFMWWVAMAVYAIPIILLGIVFSILGAATGGASSEEVSGVLGIATLCMNCLMGLYALLMAVVLPAAMVRFADKWSLKDAFELGAIKALITKKPGAYATAIVVAMLGAMAGSLGSIACVIGVIFTTFYGTLAGMHALGQFAAETEAIEGSGVVLPEDDLLDEPEEEDLAPLDDEPPAPTE